MKILIYGAGVVGSYLAHVLVRAGNEVTVLARGKRLAELRESGLVIRHYIQCRTTVDRVRTLEVLPEDDRYDLIFVVMQYTQLLAVLPALAMNHSHNIIFVGNNVNAAAIESYLHEQSIALKRVAFGFQSTGGRREAGRVICVRAGGHMELGGLDGPLPWRPLIDRAFAGTKYRLTYFDNMEAWLRSHIALILPLCYAAYACEGDLRRAARDSQMLGRIIDAIDEGYKVLENLGFPIIPAKEERLVRGKRRLFYALLKITAATPVGRLAISDHAISAVQELGALSRGFEEWKHQAKVNTPNWDGLEREFYQEIDRQRPS